MLKSYMIVSARVRFEPGDAAKVIAHFDREIQPGDKVVLWLRVSHRQNRSHLAQQEAALRAAAAARGAIVVGIVVYLGPAYDHEYPGKWWSIEIAEAAAFARRKGAKLLATETDRFVRHPSYHSVDWPEAQARNCDLQYLKSLTKGARLVTLAHPNISAAEARSRQIMRAREATGRKGGRPRITRPGEMARRRSRLRPLARRLHRRGLTLDEITIRRAFAQSKPRPVSRSTIHNWISA